MKEYGKINAKLFGQLLAAYRKKNGFTQQMVADYIGSERSTYAKYETGRKPEIGVLAKLCTLYGVTADEFLSVFADGEENAGITPAARLKAPKREMKDGTIILITPEEKQLLELYRKSVRKDDIIDYAKTVLSEENNEE